MYYKPGKYPRQVLKMLLLLVDGFRNLILPGNFNSGLLNEQFLVAGCRTLRVPGNFNSRLLNE